MNRWVIPDNDSDSETATATTGNTSITSTTRCARRKKKSAKSVKNKNTALAESSSSSEDSKLDSDSDSGSGTVENKTAEENVKGEDGNGTNPPPWVRLGIGPREYTKLLASKAGYDKMPGTKKRKCRVCNKYQSFEMMIKGKTKCQKCRIEYEPQVKFALVPFRKRQFEYEMFVQNHLATIREEVELRRIATEKKLIPPTYKRRVTHKKNWRNNFANVSVDVVKVFKEKILASSVTVPSHTGAKFGGVNTVDNTGLPKVEEPTKSSYLENSALRRPQSAGILGSRSSSSRSISFQECADQMHKTTDDIEGFNLKQIAEIIESAPVDQDDAVELSTKFDDVLSSVITGSQSGTAIGGSRDSLPSIRVDSWSIKESCSELVMIIKLNAKESLEKADCLRVEHRAPERSVSFSNLESGKVLPLAPNRRKSVLKWSSLAADGAEVADKEESKTAPATAATPIRPSPGKLMRNNSMVALKTPTQPLNSISRGLGSVAESEHSAEGEDGAMNGKVPRFGVATRPMGKVLHYPLAIATLPPPVDPDNWSGIYCVSMTLQSKIFSVDDNPHVHEETRKFRYSETGRLSVEYDASEDHGDYDFTFGIGLKPRPQQGATVQAKSSGCLVSRSRLLGVSSLGSANGSCSRSPINFNSSKRSGSVKNSYLLRKLYQKYGGDSPLIETTAAYQNQNEYEDEEDRLSNLVDDSVVDDDPYAEPPPTRPFRHWCHDGFGSCANSWGIQCPVEICSQVKGQKKLRSNKRASVWSHGGAASTFRDVTHAAGTAAPSVEKLPRNVVMKAGNIVDVVIDLKKQEAYLCISKWVRVSNPGAVNSSSSQPGRRQLLYMKRVSLTDVLSGGTTGAINPEDILVGCTIPAGYDAVIIVPGDESKYNVVEEVKTIKYNQQEEDNVWNVSDPKPSWRKTAKSFADKFDDIKKHIARTHIPDIKLDVTDLLPPPKACVNREHKPWESNLAPLYDVNGKEWSRVGLVTETEDPIRLTLDMYEAMLHPAPTMTNEQGEHHDEHHNADCPVLWLKGILGVVPKEALQVGHLMPTEIATSIELHNGMAANGVHVYACRFLQTLGVPDIINKKTRASAYTAEFVHNEIKSMKSPGNGTMPQFPDLSQANLADLSTLDKMPNLKHLSLAPRGGGSLLDKKTVSYVCTSCFEFAHASSYYVEYVKVDNAKELVRAYLYDGKVTDDSVIARYTKGAKSTKIDNSNPSQAANSMASDPRVKILGSYQPRKQAEIESILNIADTKGRSYQARIVCVPARSDCDYLLHMLHSNIKYVWKKGVTIYNEPGMFDKVGLPSYTVYPPIYAVAASHGPLEGMHQYIVRYCPVGQHGILSGRYDVLTEYVGLSRNHQEYEEEQEKLAKIIAEKEEAERISKAAHSYSSSLESSMFSPGGIGTKMRDDFDDTEELLNTFKELQKEQDELAHHHSHTHGHAAAHALNRVNEHKEEKEKVAADEPVPIIAHGIPGYRILRSRMWCFTSDTHKLHVDGVKDNYTCLIGGCEQFNVMRDMEFLCVGK